MDFNVTLGVLKIIGCDSNKWQHLCALTSYLTSKKMHFRQILMSQMEFRPSVHFQVKPQFKYIEALSVNSINA